MIFLAACSPGSSPTPTSIRADTDPQIERQLQIFDSLDQAIKDSFVYEDFGGTDWRTLSSEFRTRIETGLGDEAFYSELSALIDQLPEGSAAFVSREERIDSEREESELYEGIGAFVTFRSDPVPHIVILSIIADSPAESAGLQAHDSIYAIDGQPVSEEEGFDAVERIRGPRGSTVSLEVASPGEAPRDIQVSRGQVLAVDVPRGGLYESGIYYFLVPVNADSSLLGAVEDVFQRIQEENLQGLIFDLRIAHSTSEWPLGELLTAFTDGQLGAFISRDQRRQLEIQGQDFAGSQSISLAVLVGPDTSGAPEIFASAVGESGRAHIIGLPTPGNVLGFEQVTLLDGSIVVFSTTTYETISGADLAQTGISPDILIESDWDQATMDTDPVLLTAITTLLEETDQP